MQFGGFWSNLLKSEACKFGFKLKNDLKAANIQDFCSKTFVDEIANVFLQHKSDLFLL